MEQRGEEGSVEWKEGREQGREGEATENTDEDTKGRDSTTTHMHTQAHTHTQAYKHIQRRALAHWEKHTQVKLRLSDMPANAHN